MVKKIAAGLAFLLMLASSAAAQVNIRGQLLLPNGGLPSEPVRFRLTSEDARIDELRYTDSNGRFILERISDRVYYTVFVEGDGSLFGDTTYSFLPTVNGVVRVTLNPARRKPAASGFSISAASGYKPLPRAADLHSKAMSELKKNRLGPAEELLRQAVEADPKFAGAFNDLGALLMQQGKYAEAEKTLSQALQADPKSIYALLNLGITLNHLGKFSEAIETLREALRLEPHLVTAHLHLGIALVETDQFQEAGAELTRALKSPGEHIALGQLYLGKLYARTGDFQKAIEALNLYLEKAPTASNANEIRALIERLKRESAARR